MVGIYHRFNGAYRSNDVGLFIHALWEIIPEFFAANQPNYSRWMVQYYLNLVIMDDTHPGVKDMLTIGAFSIRKTGISFSRSPTDVTLEQTTNADAASKQTGTAAFSFESAWQRWTLTRFAMSTIVGNLLNKAGLKPVDDITQSLWSHRIKKDREDFDSGISCIENTMNPITFSTKDSLHTTMTGWEVPVEIKDNLLDCIHIGEQWHQEVLLLASMMKLNSTNPYIDERWRTSLQQQVNAVRGKDEKLAELTNAHNLFGRLLYISTWESWLVQYFGIPTYPFSNVFGTCW